MTIKKIKHAFIFAIALLSATHRPIKPIERKTTGIMLAIAACGFWYKYKETIVKKNWLSSNAAGNIDYTICGLVAYFICNLNYSNFQKSNNKSEINCEINCEKISNEENKTKTSDIIGIDHVVNEINDTIKCIKNPESYQKFDAQLSKGILLEGPPGTGKTMIAKAIAKEAGCPFFYASASSFENKYVGTGAENVRQLFNAARKEKFAIIFIDELDAIGSRGAKGSDMSHQQTIIELLTQIDGFINLPNILILAATNHKDAIDPALLRSARIDRIIKVPLLDTSGRYDLLKHLQKIKPHIQISDGCLKKVAEATEGLGAADIKNIFNQAALSVVKEQGSKVTDIHLETATQKIINERVNNQKK